MKLRGFYNMDCMEGMKEIPDKYFDLAIVDPPYGIGESQCGSQWDGSTVDIKSKDTITRVRKRLFRNDLFRVESDGRIVEIHKSIINRYFREMEE